MYDLEDRHGNATVVITLQKQIEQLKRENAELRSEIKKLRAEKYRSSKTL